MTEKRTITESELAKATGLLPYRRDRIKPEELSYALDRVGIETVPDPAPEPDRSSILRDKMGYLWVYSERRCWVALTLPARPRDKYSWDALVAARGPLTEYRKVD